MSTLDSSAPSILVTGSTGTIGQAVVHALRELAVPVVAGARDPGKAERLFGGNAVVRRLDWSDASTYSEALEGIDRVFLLGPPLEPAVDGLLAPFIEEIRGRDLVNVTYLSAYGMEKLDGLMGFHAQLEAQIQSLPCWTILRPGFFASNFVHYYGPYLEQGVLALPCGDGQTAFVDPADVGAGAARVLTHPQDHAGRIYTLTGPRSLNFAAIAALLSEQLGRPIRYEAVTTEAFEQGLEAFGMPPVLRRYMSDVYGLIRHGHVAEVQPGVRQLLHREPRSLEDYLRQTFGDAAKAS